MTDHYLQDLGGDLVLRRSRPNDMEALALFNGTMHGDNELDAHTVAEWTRTLLGGTHPTFGEDDFTIIEETATGRIVSTCNLISQTWSYEGIPFGVGRPELVGTLKEYRRRGLVRIQFDLLHQWSQERGELVQAITGIPYYYRQFGYEMTINLDSGRIGYQLHIPQLAEGQAEPFNIRPAVEADLPFMMQLTELSSQRYGMCCLRTPELWRYELLGRRSEDINREVLNIIETPGGEPVGFFGHPFHMWKTGYALHLFEIAPGASWLEISPGVIRYLWALGQKYAAQHNRPCTGVLAWLGEEHPIYSAMPGSFPVKRGPYAWYIRVPDLAAFIQRIAPALEKRLENSICHGYSGELKLSFYRKGFLMAFDQGKLVKAENLAATQLENASAAFPDLAFLKLLFCYRSLDEIRYAFPDCWCNDSARPLLEVLFPRRPMDLWPIS
jgi:hypothetical protein